MKLLKLLPFLLFLSSIAGEKILFIGNSYTGGIKGTVTQLFKEQKTDAKLEFINPGGKNLMFHFKNAKTIERIKKGDYDKIILQDQSQTPALPGYNKIFHDATAEFAKLFKSLKKKPTVYYYMTWGRRDGDKRNKNIFPDYPTMQKALTENYSKAAKKNGAIIVPAGLAYRELFKKDKELFRSLYAGDGSHTGKNGAYLISCVFYAVLFKKDPVKDIKWNSKLDAKTAAKLRQIAKTTLSLK